MGCGNCEKKPLEVVARRPLEVTGRRPCKCDEKTCRLCSLYHSDPRYKRLWGGAVEPINFEMRANGIGDALCGLLAVAGAKAKNPQHEVCYYVKDNNHQWVRLFDGYDSLYALGEKPAKDLNHGYDVECTTRGLVPRWKRYCVNADSEPVVPKMKDKAKLLEQGKAYAGVVCVCPFSV